MVIAWSSFLSLANIAKAPILISLSIKLRWGHGVACKQAETEENTNFSSIYLKVQFLVIFAYFYLPLWPPTLLSLTKLLSLGAFAMMSLERKLIQAITIPISSTICLKILFLVIFSFYCLFTGNPLTLPQLLSIKMLKLGAVAIFFKERKLLQAITTLSSCHFLENVIFSYFWPFTPICACLWATPWLHLCFYLQK